MSRTRNPETNCHVADCDRIATVRGLCGKHYQSARKRSGFVRVNRSELVTARGGDPPMPIKSIKCGVEYCESGPVALGLCARHYRRYCKHGDPLITKSRGAKRIHITIPNETSPTKLGLLLGVSKQRAHQILNRHAHNARRAVNEGLKTGRITKPSACERCQKATDDLEAHHWDYREVLDVRWLCPPCHSIVHPHGNKYGRNGKPTNS